MARYDNVNGLSVNRSNGATNTTGKKLAVTYSNGSVTNITSGAGVSVAYSDGRHDEFYWPLAPLEYQGRTSGSAPNNAVVIQISVEILFSVARVEVLSSSSSAYAFMSGSILTVSLSNTSSLFSLEFSTAATVRVTAMDGRYLDIVFSATFSGSGSTDPGDPGGGNPHEF
jgi:hypothetical protein